MNIRVLPPEVANKIAAGEVVERPASVVKELVENALDAGARHVSIEMQEGGKRLIQVADDGMGISADQVELAFQRHATSKLNDVDDLQRIATLGFRGEALASIAAVSRLTMMTRAQGETHGTQVYIEGGHLLDHEVVGAPQGTMVTVENLFFNVPARLKFLKRESTERGRVGAVVSRYALAYPDVRFTLQHGNQEVLRTTGSGSLRDALVDVMGVEVVDQMIELHPETNPPQRDDLPPIDVYGFIGMPSLNRANRSQINLFVNGRWIQDNSLSYAVTQAYHTMLMTGRYPIVVLMVDMPPEEVDVNVHPTKAEVRFRRSDAVFSAVQRVVRRALVDHAPPPSIRTDVLWGTPEMQDRRERLARVTEERMSQLGIDLNLESPGRYTTQQPPEDEDDPAPARRKRELPILRVIGQVGAMYVIAEGTAGIYLVDQHAAHERVLYEQFMAEHVDAEPASQELLEPVAIELLPDDMVAVEANIEDLRAVGFGIEPFGRNTVQVRAVPAILADGDPASALRAALGDIECGDMPTESTAEERLIARVCKQVAIKAGQVLTYVEMEALIRQLEDCEAPRTCPHGRPTMLHLSAEQLAKEFGRLGAI